MSHTPICTCTKYTALNVGNPDAPAITEKVIMCRMHSAAPALLEACAAIIEWHDLIKQNYPEMVGLIHGMEQARAAIAAAEGK